jgi:DNA (cytosine-5)-methyltransferase 1
MQKPAFRFIDLFAGIGGMRLGFEAAGGECVFTCEWDEKAQETYRANFGAEHAIHGDITKLDVASIPQHDVLVAGFPCQPFSIAGVSKKNALGRPHGFNCDEQGNLFFNIVDILSLHRPPAFLLENVKNLVSHDKGRTFTRIKHELETTLRYKIAWKVIDARAFVPQHRERTFIVGFRDGHPFDFCALEHLFDRDGPRLSAILHSEDGQEHAELPYTEGKRAKVSKKYVLTEHLWTYLQNYAEKHRAKGNGFGFGRVGPHSVARTLSARYYKDGSEILVERTKGPPRRLTPRECARLMGFDGTHRGVFKIPVSDTRAYKQFGNAVVVPVVAAVANAMLPRILELTGRKPKTAGRRVRVFSDPSRLALYA